MRYGYWWIEALVGVLLIISPVVVKFTELWAAAYADVVLGLAVVIWALVGYWSMGEMKPQWMVTTRS